jgi:hypothetical protein
MEAIDETRMYVWTIAHEANMRPPFWRADLLSGPAQSLGELGTRLGPRFDKAQKKNSRPKFFFCFKAQSFFSKVQKKIHKT